MDFQLWMHKATDSIENSVQPGQKFELKSLFQPCEWEQLSKGERISFGKYFANEVREGKIENIRAIERAKNNHCNYIKDNVEVSV